MQVITAETRLAAMALIKRHEDCRLTMYMCPAGFATIGWGHNLASKPISHVAAEEIFVDDFRDAVQDCKRLFGADFEYFSPPRQIALIDMAYNLGYQGLKSFRKMRAAIARHDWNEAANQAEDSAWYRQVGRRGEEIVGLLRVG